MQYKDLESLKSDSVKTLICSIPQLKAVLLRWQWQRRFFEEEPTV